MSLNGLVRIKPFCLHGLVRVKPFSLHNKKGGGGGGRDPTWMIQRVVIVANPTQHRTCRRKVGLEAMPEASKTL
jgi:hypothetical protein